MQRRKRGIVHARHPSAELTGAVLLCLSSQAQGQAAAPTPTFVVHGSSKTCSAITQLDSALSTDSQQFFAGWTERDYADALAWSQACADYGWHIAGRPRIPLLQAQHDRALGPAPSIPAQAVPSATGTAQPSPAAQARLLAPAPPAPSTAAGETASEGEGDGLLTDEYYKAHFHEESVWVANKAHLDIGDDRGPSTWPTGGTSAQMKNRLTADRIVLYCAKKSTSGDAGNRPLLWDWRRCEAQEAAYNRLVAENEFPTAGRGIVLGCAGVDSYIHLERCIETLTNPAKR